MLHHRFEHLGGDDHRLVVAAGAIDELPLHGGDLLRRQLDAEIAAGHHDAVGRLEDCVDVGERLGPLDLRDDVHVVAVAGHQLPERLAVRSAAHEGQAQEVDSELEGEARVGVVLVREAGRGQRALGQVDSLAVLQPASSRDEAVNLAFFDLLDFELQGPVGEQDGVAG